MLKFKSFFILIFVCLSCVTCKISKDIQVNNSDVVETYISSVDSVIYLYSPIQVGGFLNRDGLSFARSNKIELLAANNPDFSKVLINIIESNENRMYKEVYLDTSITSNKYINFHTEKFYENVSSELRKSKNISKQAENQFINEFPDVHLRLYFTENKQNCLLITTSYFKEEPFKQEYYLLSKEDNQWRLVIRLL